MSTLNFALKNQTGSNTVYAYITGQAIDNNNALVLLQADGTTAYYPTSPSSTGTALAVDCAIPLGASGSTKTVTIPHIAGGRIWFCRDSKLTFYLNPGPALVEPSSSNTSDVNYNLYWDFCEFTWNSSQLYVNITFVDFVSLPIALALTNTSGTTTTVQGLPSNGLDTICTALKTQNNSDSAGWDKLIITKNGANLRAVSPNNGINLNSSLFSTYYDAYVDSVWSKYASATLTVNTQGDAGDVTATVSNGTLNFSTGNISYSQPSTADIFSNSSGAFASTGNSTKDAITARLAAAFNRSTMLTVTNQPNGGTVSNYYQNAVTNHYSRICHATTLDGRGYAFPYDDVAPTNGTDQSGSVYDSNPKLLTVTVGGSSSSSSSTKKTTNQDQTAPSQDNQTNTRFAGLKKVLSKLSCMK
ncbi:Glucan endo-1-3-beta-glucosidase [Penicillium macrosclerotiorum]|uniref:Glucan endo-1-3-beta-glucosidase n=1 Tax=Penicillium macrosclerotiorum TaxID=303699 RepID=UPI0025489363|nr:Glucan endo-1-3-beta-glucosidase [Penicillium macrosclerotiorum]KAJ5675470.1 Glucan endo-1-3-beta-glucosidase [Penicillium macrosclerotiorum]